MAAGMIQDRRAMSVVRVFAVAIALLAGCARSHPTAPPATAATERAPHVSAEDEADPGGEGTLYDRMILDFATPPQ